MNQLQKATKEQSKKLMDLGFNLDSSSIFPPTALALKWLRDEKKIDVNVLPNCNANGRIYFCQVIIFHADKIEVKKLTDPSPIPSVPMTIYETHEIAESAGLDYAIDFLIKKQTTN